MQFLKCSVSIDDVLSMHASLYLLLKLQILLFLEVIDLNKKYKLVAIYSEYPLLGIYKI